jgi:hypothetical protein
MTTTATQPLPSWAFKSSDPGDAWVVDIGGIVRPITNELSRVSAAALFMFDTEAHANDAKAYFGNEALVEGVSVGMVSGTLAGAGIGSPSNPIAPFSGVDAIGAFFNRLTEGNTWLRIGEAVLGIILVAVALGKLTGLEDSVKSAAVSAVKVAK